MAQPRATRFIHIMPQTIHHVNPKSEIFMIEFYCFILLFCHVIPSYYTVITQKNSNNFFSHFSTAVDIELSLILSHCAHAVQFEGAEWDRSCSPTERLRCPRPPPTTGSMKLRKPSEPHSMVGERVDPTLPLEKQVYVQHAPQAIRGLRKKLRVEQRRVS